jgi:two-component system OmpR family response regulator
VRAGRCEWCDPGVNSGDARRLLVVDDEPLILDGVATSLRYQGFAVDTAATGRAALRQARETEPDLLVLDVLLPDVDGFAVVRRLRQEGSTVPVIFLTARDTQQDKVIGLGWVAMTT